MSESRNDPACVAAAHGDEAERAARKRSQEQKIQRQLDEALADSFPASDPVSIVTSHAEEDWGAEAGSSCAEDGSAGSGQGAVSSSADPA